jgi:hypothetical protein
LKKYPILQIQPELGLTLLDELGIVWQEIHCWFSSWKNPSELRQLIQPFCVVPEGKTEVQLEQVL